MIATHEVVMLTYQGGSLQQIQQDISQMRRDGWELVVPPTNQDEWPNPENYFPIDPRRKHKFWIAVLKKPL